MLFKRIEQRKRQARNVKIIVVDPRRTPTAAIADIHLAVRPGTDVALLNSMLAEIVLWHGLVDQSFIDRAHGGLGRDARLPRSATRPERVARGIGVDAEDIRSGCSRLRAGGRRL